MKMVDGMVWMQTSLQFDIILWCWTYLIRLEIKTNMAQKIYHDLFVVITAIYFINTKIPHLSVNKHDKIHTNIW